MLHIFSKNFMKLNRGITLIELLVALGISAIVLGGGYKLYLEFTNVQLNAAKAKAAQQEMATLGEVIKNHFSMRASEHVTTSDPYVLKDMQGVWMRTLEISSHKSNAGVTSLYQVIFTTNCESIPAKLAKLDLTSLSDGQFVPCQPCRAGSLPVVQLSIPGVAGAEPSARLFPTLRSSNSIVGAKNDILAMGVCFKEHHGVSAYIEAAWLTRDHRIERASQIIKLNTTSMDKIKIVR